MEETDIIVAEPISGLLDDKNLVTLYRNQVTPKLPVENNNQHGPRKIGFFQRYRRNLGHPTLLARSILLLGCELVNNMQIYNKSDIYSLAQQIVNLLLWIVAIILFAPDPSKRSVLPLCLIAWTLGLRHGLDADHICAIDNSIRRLIPLGRLPVTVGLYFSYALYFSCSYFIEFDDPTASVTRRW